MENINILKNLENLTVIFEGFCATHLRTYFIYPMNGIFQLKNLKSLCLTISERMWCRRSRTAFRDLQSMQCKESLERLSFVGFDFEDETNSIRFFADFKKLSHLNFTSCNLLTDKYKDSQLNSFHNKLSVLRVIDCNNSLVRHFTKNLRHSFKIITSEEDELPDYIKNNNKISVSFYNWRLSKHCPDLDPTFAKIHQ
mgnify:CR=1 FL=1